MGWMEKYETSLNRLMLRQLLFLKLKLSSLYRDEEESQYSYSRLRKMRQEVDTVTRLLNQNENVNFKQKVI